MLAGLQYIQTPVTSCVRAGVGGGADVNGAFDGISSSPQAFSFHYSFKNKGTESTLLEDSDNTLKRKDNVSLSLCLLGGSIQAVRMNQPVFSGEKGEDVELFINQCDYAWAGV